MSYNDRKQFRHELLQREFNDKYTMDPNEVRSGKDFTGEVYDLLSTVTSKRELLTSRHKKLDEARAYTLSLDTSKLIENTQKKLQKENESEEYEKLMERYRRGDHVLRNMAKEEKDDAELESKMHAQGALLFKNSQPMSDFGTTHIGEVNIPTYSHAKTAQLQNSKQYIKLTKVKLDIFKKYLFYKEKILKMNESINNKEEAKGTVMMRIEAYKQSNMNNCNDFDYLLLEYNQVKVIDNELIVLKEDLEYCTSQYDQIVKTIDTKYPDMACDIFPVNSNNATTSNSYPNNDNMSFDSTDNGDGVIRDTSGTAVMAVTSHASDSYDDLVPDTVSTGPPHVVHPMGTPQSIQHSSNMHRTQSPTSLTVQAASTAPVQSPKLSPHQRRKEVISNVYGWIVGRLSREGKVTNMCFGQFTQVIQVPHKNWIFVGRNISMDVLIETQRDMLTKDIHVDETTLQTMKKDDIHLKLSHSHFEKREIFVESLNEASNLSKSGTTKRKKPRLRSIQISGCSHYDINGRYLECGDMNNAIKYRNVNGWYVFRHVMQEIPELGIYADNCYLATSKEKSIMNDMDLRAGEIVNQITDPNSTIEDGSAKFKRLFSELSRTGSRMITADHQLDLLRTEDLKANVRFKSSEDMLMIIAATQKQIDNITGGNETIIERDEEDVGEDNGIPFSRGKSLSRKSSDRQMLRSSSSRNFGRSAVYLPDDMIVEDDNDCNVIATSIPNTPSIKKNLSRKESPEKTNGEASRNATAESEGAYQNGITPDDIYVEEENDDDAVQLNPSSGVSGIDNEDFKILMSKNLQYQIESQGYMLLHNKSLHSTIESEISSVVLQCITNREMYLQKLMMESGYIEKQYIQSDALSEEINKDKALASVLSCMQSLRYATLEVLEAIGAWARIVSKKAHYVTTEKHYLQAKEIKHDRTYAVVISLRGKELYPPSLAMVSNNRKFSRGIEPAKQSIQIQYVGAYPTKEKACEAFRVACTRIPLELRYAPYKNNSCPDVFIGLRPCGKHYLVRCIGVPNDLECEQCKANAASNANLYISQATKCAFPQFLYHGNNYLDKMWKDSDFLRKLTFLKEFKKYFISISNPLLLTKTKLFHVLNKVVKFQSYHAKQVDANTNASLPQQQNGSNETTNLNILDSIDEYCEIDVEPLHSLKSKMEILYDAKEVVKTLSIVIKEKPKVGIPYRMPGKLPNLDADYYSVIDGNGRVLFERNDLNATRSPIKSTLLQDTFRDGVVVDEAFVDEQNSVSNITNELSSHIDMPNTLYSLSAPTSANGVKQLSANRNKTKLAPLAKPTTILPKLNNNLGATAFRQSDANMLLSSSKLNDTWLHEFDNNVLLNMENDINAIGVDRFERAMVILGQSTLLKHGLIEKQLAMGEALVEVDENGFVEAETPSNGVDESPVQVVSKLKQKLLTSQSQNALLSQSGKSLKDTNLVPTKATWSHYGATLSSIQYRKPVGYRIENIWCRSDVGEWKGLTKGRKMRAFDYQDMLVTTAKEKIERRERIQNELREELLIDFVSSRLDIIAKLMEEAQEFKGSVLDLVVIQAELYLKNRILHIESTIKVQRIYRGRLGRKKAKIAYHLKWDPIRRLLTLETELHKFSRVLIPNIIETAMKNQIKRLTKPVCKVTASYGGIPYIISVYLSSKKLKKSHQLCQACLGKSVTQIYNCNRHASEKVRCVCTCQMIQEKESWLLHAYDPINCIIYERRIAEKEYTVIANLCYQQSLYTSRDHMLKLYGNNFDQLISLLQQEQVDMNTIINKGYCIDMNKSITTAKLKSSLEYSRSVLHPVEYTDSVLYSIYNKKIAPNLQAIFNEYTKNDYKYNSPIIVENVNASDMTECDPLRDIISWEPLSLSVYTNYIKDITPRVLNVMRSFTNETQEEYTIALNEYNVFVNNQYNYFNMEFEDTVGYLIQVTSQYEIATSRIKQVMGFVQYEKHKFLQEEKQLQEDWYQSYDSLQDANAWKNLNDSRKYNQELKNLVKIYEMKRNNLENMLIEKQNLYVIMKQKQKLAEFDQSVIEKYGLFTRQLASSAKDIKKLTTEYVNIVTSQLTIQNIHSIKPSLRLKYISHDLKYIRDVAKRTKIEYRSFWNIMHRKVHILQTNKLVDDFLYNHIQYRFIVTIYQDPVTKYYILSFDHQNPGNEELINENLKYQLSKAQAFYADAAAVSSQCDMTRDGKIRHKKKSTYSIVTEEMSLHVDNENAIAEYSGISQYLQPNEILLSGEEIQALLFSKAHIWPENMPKVKKIKTLRQLHSAEVDDMKSQGTVSTTITPMGNVDEQSDDMSVDQEHAKTENKVAVEKDENCRGETIVSSEPVIVEDIVGTDNIECVEEVKNLLDPCHVDDAADDAADNGGPAANVAISDSANDMADAEVRVNAGSCIDLPLDNDNVSSNVDTPQLNLVPLSAVIDSQVIIDINDKYMTRPYDAALPSSFAHSVLQVIPYSKHMKKRSAAHSGYIQARRDKQYAQDTFIARLLQYIRLNPFSLRPTIGLIPFSRRQSQFYPKVQKNLWYRDLHKHDCSQWINDYVINKRKWVVKDEMLVQARDMWGNMLIRLRSNNGEMKSIAHQTEIYVAFETILDSLVISPAMFGAFLCETIINRYSLDTVSYILRHIDKIQRNENHQFWRKTFYYEGIPKYNYVVEEKDLYRGCIYNGHKFITYHYFNVKVYQSSNFGLYFILDKPTDGLFWTHAYRRSKPIEIVIPISEIKAFLLKKSYHFSKKTDNYYQNTSNASISHDDIDKRQADNSHSIFLRDIILNLFHSLYIMDLIQVILHCIDIPFLDPLKQQERDSIHNSTSQSAFTMQSKSKAMHHNDISMNDDENSQYSAQPNEIGFDLGDSECGSFDENGDIKYDERYEDLTWRERLKVRLWKVILRFNLWVVKHQIKIKPVTKNTMNKLFSSLSHQDENNQVDWKLVHRESLLPSRKEDITVYDGLWLATDPRRISTKDAVNIANANVQKEVQKKQHQQYNERKLTMHLNGHVKDKRDKEDEMDSDASTAFIKDSYWSVIMKTNEMKSIVSISLYETDSLNPDASADVSKLETHFMTTEDANSSKSAALLYEMELERHYAYKRYLQPVIPTSYIELLQRERQVADVAKIALRKLQTKILSCIDAFFDKLALCSFKICSDAMEVNFIEIMQSNGSVVVDDLDDEGDKVNDNDNWAANLKKTKKIECVLEQESLNDQLPNRKCRYQPFVIPVFQRITCDPPPPIHGDGEDEVIEVPIAKVNKRNDEENNDNDDEAHAKNNDKTAESKEPEATLMTPDQKQKNLIQNSTMWLESIMESLKYSNCFITTCKILCVNRDLPVKAYPNVPVPEKASLTSGRTSSMDKKEVAAMKNKSDVIVPLKSFRTSTGWKRCPLDAQWEASALSRIDSNFVTKAKKSVPPKIININGELVMVSAPNIGPYDYSSVNMYVPMRQNTIQVIFQTNLELPYLEGLKGFDNQKKSYHEVEESDRIEPKVRIAKECAKRIVWKSLIHGITLATIRGVEKAIDEKIVDVQRFIFDKLQELVSPHVPPKTPQLEDVELEARKLPIIRTIQHSFDASSMLDTTLSSDMAQNTTTLIHPAGEESDFILPFNTNSTAIVPTDYQPASSMVSLDSLKQVSFHSVLETSVSSSICNIPHVQIHAVYIPIDENIFPTVFSSTRSSEVHQQCLHLLSCSDMNYLYRHMTFPCIIYSAIPQVNSHHTCGAANADRTGLKNDVPNLSTSNAHNLRLSRFLFDYVANNGWKLGMDYVKYRQLLAKAEKKEYFDASPNLFGNCVLLFRYGEKDLHHFMNWCHQRKLHNESIANQRLKRINDEKRRRHLNFIRYRKFIYCVALQYRYSFESLFYYDNFMWKKKKQHLLSSDGHITEEMVHDNNYISNIGQYDADDKEEITSFMIASNESDSTRPGSKDYVYSQRVEKYYFNEHTDNKEEIKNILPAELLPHVLEMDVSSIYVRILLSKFIELCSSDFETQWHYIQLMDYQYTFAESFTTFSSVLSIKAKNNDIIYSNFMVEQLHLDTEWASYYLFNGDMYMNLPASTAANAKDAIEPDTLTDTCNEKDVIKLRPQCGQILYLLYQIHCNECQVDHSTCGVPGCGMIRLYMKGLLEEYKESQEARMDSKGDEFAGIAKMDMRRQFSTMGSSDIISNANQSDSNTAKKYNCTSPDTLFTVGNGNSPLELSVKKYLYNASKQFQCHVVIPTASALPTNNEGNIYDDDISNSGSKHLHDDDMSICESLDESVNNYGLVIGKYGALHKQKDPKELLFEVPEVSKNLKSMEWRTVQNEALNMRYINRHIVDIHFRQYLEAEDVICAKGGHDHVEENTLLYEDVDALNAYVPFDDQVTPWNVHMRNNDNNGSNENNDNMEPALYNDSIIDGVESANSNSFRNKPVASQTENTLNSNTSKISRYYENVPSEFTIHISTSLIRTMRGGDAMMNAYGANYSTVNDSEAAVPIWWYDPAPERYKLSNKEQEHITKNEMVLNELNESEENGQVTAVNSNSGSMNIMSADMYQWLIQHLKISREISYIPVSVDADSYIYPSHGGRSHAYHSSKSNTSKNVHRISEPKLLFDRLYYEKMCYSRDGSFIMLQILQGIMYNKYVQKMNDDGDDSNADVKCGCPAPALRYVPTDKLHDMEYGLTLLVHDFASDISRTVYLRQVHMQRIANIYQINPNDMQIMSNIIVKHSYDMIQLKHLNGMCVDATIYVDNSDIVPLAAPFIPNPAFYYNIKRKAEFTLSCMFAGGLSGDGDSTSDENSKMAAVENMQGRDISFQQPRTSETAMKATTSNASAPVAAAATNSMTAAATGNLSSDQIVKNQNCENIPGTEHASCYHVTNNYGVYNNHLSRKYLMKTISMEDIDDMFD